MTLLHHCQLGTKTLQVHYGDLLASRACAIVCSENTAMRMDAVGGPSVSAAIRREEGEALVGELARRGPVAFGTVLSQEARKLPARFIFFAATVARSRDGDFPYTTSAAAIRRATREAVRLGNNLGLSRLAFGAFGVRGAGFPAETAAALQLESVVAALREPGTVHHVDFVLNDMQVFLHYFRSAIVNTLSEDARRAQLGIERRDGTLLLRLVRDEPLSRVWEQPLDERTRAGLDGDFAARATRLRSRVELERLGRALAACLPEGLRTRLLQLEPSVLTLRVVAGLHTVPWELLALDGELLFERHQVGRHLLVPDGEAPPERGHEPSLLVIADPSDDLPGTRREAERLLAALPERGPRLRLLAGRRATRRAVAEALESATLVHFAGHADGAGWRLADGPFLPGPGGSGARLVVANCCHGAQLGQAFLRGGARHYIGSWRALPDTAGTAFAGALYRAVLQGERLGNALVRARAALESHDPDGVLGGAYVHYGSPLGKLPGWGMQDREGSALLR